MADLFLLMSNRDGAATKHRELFVSPSSDIVVSRLVSPSKYTMSATPQPLNPFDDCTVVFQTCDNFADCWLPFFSLFQRYWPDCPCQIVMSTESRSFTFPGLDIRPFLAARSGARSMDWSDRLRACLETIRTSFVFHIQDDYFLQNPVDSRLIAEALVVMKEEGLTHVGLTPFGPRGRLRSTKREWLCETPRLCAYRVNTQVGLWNRKDYMDYLQPGESCWQFEILGSWRSRGRPHRFANINPQLFRAKPPVDYIGTGILKGRWHPAMPALFQSHDLDVDFSKRGMYRPVSRLASKLDILMRLCKSPGRAIAALVLAR